MTNAFGGLKKAMETMINTLKQTEKEVNTTEVEQVKELLQKCDIVLRNNNDKKQLILEYETLYDQLNEFVIKKRKEIVDVEEMINELSGIEILENYSLIVNKKKENINQIIDCNNRIVERIRQLETIIYNNRMKELDNMKTQRYRELKQVEQQQPIKVDDNEMDIINNLMNVLKQWSNKNTFNVIFDSDIDGDGSDNVLYDRVLNKSNLYFITFDTDNNVFGGYISEKIDNFDYCVDRNAFVFSLIRDGNVKNRKYSIYPRWRGSAFFLNNNDKDSWLYRFGDDICVNRIGDNNSYCQYNFYNYNNIQNPLIDMTTHLTNFKAKLIIVIEMN